MKNRIAIALICSSLCVFAQNDSLKQVKSTTPLCYYLSWGIGGGNLSSINSNLSDFNSNLGFDFVINKHHQIKTRWIYGTEEYKLRLFGDDDNVKESFSDIGFLYGYSLNIKKLRLNAMLGLGWINEVKRGKVISQTRGAFGWFSVYNYVYEKIENNNISFPYEISFDILPTRNFGISAFKFYGSLNSVHSYYSFGVAINVGKVRSYIK